MDDYNAEAELQKKIDVVRKYSPNNWWRLTRDYEGKNFNSIPSDELSIVEEFRNKMIETRDRLQEEYGEDSIIMTETPRRRVSLIKGIRYESGEQIATCDCGCEIRGKDKFFTYYMLNQIETTRAKTDLTVLQKSKLITQVGISTDAMRQEFTTDPNINSENLSLRNVYCSPVSFHIIQCPECGAYLQFDRNTMQALTVFHLSKILMKNSNLVKSGSEYSRPCRVEYKPEAIKDYLDKIELAETQSDYTNGLTTDLINEQEELFKTLKTKSASSIMILTEMYTSLTDAEKDDLTVSMQDEYGKNIEEILTDGNGMSDEDYRLALTNVFEKSYDFEKPESNTEEGFTNWFSKTLQEFNQNELTSTEELEEIASDINKDFQDTMDVTEIEDIENFQELLKESFDALHKEEFMTILEEENFKSSAKILRALQILASESSRYVEPEEFFKYVVEDDEKNITIFNLFKMHYFYLKLKTAIEVYAEIAEAKMHIDNDIIDYSSTKQSDLKFKISELYQELYDVATGTSDSEKSFVEKSEVMYDNSIEGATNLINAVGSKFYYKSLACKKHGVEIAQSVFTISSEICDALLRDLIKITGRVNNGYIYSVSRKENASKYITNRIDWQFIYGLYLIDVIVLNTTIFKVKTTKQPADNVKSLTAGDKYNHNVINFRDRSSTSFKVTDKEEIVNTLRADNPVGSESLYYDTSYEYVPLAPMIQNSLTTIMKTQIGLTTKDTDSRGSVDCSKHVYTGTYKVMLRDFLTESLTYIDCKPISASFPTNEETLTQSIEVEDSLLTLTDDINYYTIFNKINNPACYSVLSEMLKASSYNEALRLIQNLKNKEALADLDVSADDEDKDFESDTDALKYDAELIIKYTALYLQIAKISIIPEWIKTLDTNNLVLNEVRYTYVGGV
jgi:hypothetical protein